MKLHQMKLQASPQNNEILKLRSLLNYKYKWIFKYYFSNEKIS